jgi:hypothetical protein
VEVAEAAIIIAAAAAAVPVASSVAWSAEYSGRKAEPTSSIQQQKARFMPGFFFRIANCFALNAAALVVICPPPFARRR